LKELRMRLSAIKAIEKVTKSMKMIASARLKAAENKALQVRPYSKAMDFVLAPLFVKDEAAPAEAEIKENLYLIVASDKGLCGTINAGLLRFIGKSYMNPNHTYKYVIFGDKGRDIFKRRAPFDVLYSVGKTARTSFNDAAGIAALIADMPYKAITLFYNQFINAAMFKPVSQKLATYDMLIANRQKYYGINFDDDIPIIFQNMAEFALAAAIYGALTENFASELASRLSAMENASTNAARLFKHLNLIYNRTRQASITTEMIEIITGAECAMQ
jgi:F-type H+-transporting ATPase subunit gamma